MSTRLGRFSSAAFWQRLLVVLAAMVAGLAVAATWRWPVINDLPVLLYEGFLWSDANLVPYRDYFDVNLPGTLLLHAGLHRLTAGDPFALHGIDLLVLATVAVLTGWLLKAHGRMAGIWASSSFVLLYLATGAENSLQREYLCILPLVLSVGLVFRCERSVLGCRWALFASGFLAGLVLTIKPPLVICWLPLLHHAAAPTGGFAKPRDLIRASFFFAAGSLLAFGPVLAWLASHDALGSLLDIVRSYYPLYTQIGGTAELEPGGLGAWLHRYFWRTPALFASIGGLMAIAGCVVARRFEEPKLRAQGLTLSWLLVCAALYVPLSVKFWSYHQTPFYFAGSLTASLLLSRALPRSWAEKWASLIAGALALFLLQGTLKFWPEKDASIAWGRAEQVALLADWLRRESSPEDTVMPLDTSDGALHALYLVRRPLYGRFLNDFHFYHHVGDPYIEGLREEFLEQFGDGRPSVILQCRSWRPHVASVVARFEALEAILERDYHQVYRTRDCRVLRR